MSITEADKVAAVNESAPPALEPPAEQKNKLDVQGVAGQHEGKLCYVLQDYRLDMDKYFTELRDWDPGAFFNQRCVWQKRIAKM